MILAFGELLIFVTFFALWLVRAAHHPIADEVDFVKPMLLWVQGGPRVEGLWHAPFYPWTLMALGRFFGPSPALFRVVGALCIAITGWVGVKAARRAYPEIKQYQSLILLALLLFSPALFSSALLLDYDTTLLTVATAGFFGALLSHEKEKAPRLAVRAGLWIGLCLMAKETTPLMYPLGVTVLLWRRGEKPGRALAWSVLSLTVACALFLLTTWVWCKAYGIHMPRVFDMDVLGLKVHGGGSSNLTPLRRLWVWLTPVLWLSPSALWLLHRAAQRETGLLKRPAAAAIFSVSIAVVLAYTFALSQRTYHFPKYMAPVFPWLLWLGFMGKLFSQERSQRVNALLFSGFCLIWFALVPNPLDLLHSRSAEGVLIYAMVAGIPLGIAAFTRPRGLVLLILTLASAIPHIKQALLTQKSITYWYGETALPDARPLVREWMARHPQATLISPAKDLGLELQDLGFEYIPKDLLKGDAKMLCAQREPLLILTRVREESSLTRQPELETLKNCLATVQEHGDLVLGTNRK